MIRFVYWQHHTKYDEELEDNELFDTLRQAIYWEEDGQASVESITLPCGTVLNGWTEIEDYYDAHRNDENAVEGSAIVIDEQKLLPASPCLGLISPTVQFDTIIGYSCDTCGASCGPDEELVHYVARKKKSRRMG